MFVCLFDSLRCFCLLYFKGCQVFICDFHREQSWERWIVKKSNGCLHRKGDLLPKLRRIARSRTKSAINDAITDFKSYEFWNGSEYSKLKEYLSKYWLLVINVSEGDTIDEG